MNHIEYVTSAEIRFCMDAIEHYRRFHSYQHFVQMQVRPLRNSTNIKNVSLKKAKMFVMVKNAIAKSIVLKQAKLLQNKYFSVLLDESIDITDYKHLYILARYVNNGLIRILLY